MSLATTPEWLPLALYALGAAVVVILLFRIPYVGRVLRVAVSVGLLALTIFLLLQHAPYDPRLARLTDRLGLDSQEVRGDEVRIRMSPDGHFWARVSVNGVEQRMLIDSGATITALSAETAERTHVETRAGLMPIVLQTANGAVSAETGTVARLRVGGIEARHLNVVVSPALGPIDVLGMNFLSQLGSWRVEGQTLIMVPRRS